jgi:hypothetical protein
MRCAACQNENPDHARFCNGCGASLEVRCAACERTNPPGSRYCNGCGVELAAPPPPDPPERRDPRDYTPRHLAEKILHHKTALEGERKHVTVLFADLATSSPATA